MIQTWGPQAVLLFGSFARADVHEGSDVDIAVIANFQETFLDRICRLLDLNEGLGLPLEPVGYTPEEFRQMWEAGNRFVREIVTHGRVLAGDLAAVLPRRRPKSRPG
ncbi:MAG: nucleotidyltransferase domain-containing protein [Acidobacteria bacterium]|nr:nucleotidyltransferase domain-containing protein [Acidobacteriota bacterium]MDW7985439.1 nucleotidyltransferase domain-containing protein [Acidobacteriota bacterium]